MQIEPKLLNPISENDCSSSDSRSPLQLVRRYLLVLLALTYVMATLVPQPGRWFRSPLIESGEAAPVHILLALLLFALGLSTGWNRITDLLKHGKWLGISLLVRCLLFIVVVLLMRWLPSQLAMAAVGFLLLLAMPAATSSSGWCLHLGSSQSVCLALIAGTTLASAVTAPTLMRIGMALAPSDTVDSIGSLLATYELTFVLAWILLPMLIGMTLCTASPSFAARLRKFEQPIAPLVILLLNYANASSSLPQLRDQQENGYLLAIAAGCILLFLALLGSTTWITKRLPSDPQQRMSTVLGTCMSNTGLALVIATVAMPNAVGAHVAILAYTFVQHLGIALFSLKRPVVAA